MSFFLSCQFEEFILSLLWLEDFLFILNLNAVLVDFGLFFEDLDM
jgi:hypothetical protein